MAKKKDLLKANEWLTKELMIKDNTIKSMNYIMNLMEEQLKQSDIGKVRYKIAREHLKDGVHDFVRNKNVEHSSEKDSDVVNHPTHYTFGGIETIDAIEASMPKEEFRGYLKGNVLKYVWRYEIKGSALQDLKKAEWYLQKLISKIEG